MSAVAVEAGPMVPLAYRVTAASRDTHDTCTLELDPVGAAIEPQPGQFAMLYAWGVGEVPISLSGLTGERLLHTIRDVGAVTHALCGLGPGDDLGVRGPFGNTWPLVEGADHVVVAGGLGLAPLRPAIRALAAEPERYGRVSVLYGARTPDDLLYPREWQIWHERGLDMRVTVDAAAAGWDGTVGVVTKLVERAAFDPGSAVALVCGPEIMMRFAAPGPCRARPRPGAHVRLARAGHEVRHRPLRPLPARPDARLPRRPGLRLERGRAVAGGARAVSKPTVAVWKFASCDGCQLSLLDCEDELLAVAEQVEIAYFLEASSATVEGPYDVSIVEGSITTEHDAKRIQEIRASSATLIAIGACATSGGIQALRNFADIDGFVAAVYASPDYISTLATSTPISEHVKVDLELQGCPINKRQLLEAIGALLAGRKPNLPSVSVCVECKLRGVACVMVTRGVPCLGPVTHAGCGALCPAYARGCFGCYGPKETPNLPALREWWRGPLGRDERTVDRALATFNVTRFGE